MDPLTKSVVDHLRREVTVPVGLTPGRYEITHGHTALEIIELLRRRGYYAGGMGRELAVCAIFLGSLVATPPGPGDATVDVDEVLTEVCRIASAWAHYTAEGRRGSGRL